MCYNKKLLWNPSVAQLQILEQHLVAGITNVQQQTISLSVNSYAVLVGCRAVRHREVSAPPGWGLWYGMNWGVEVAICDELGVRSWGMQWGGGWWLWVVVCDDLGVGLWYMISWGLEVVVYDDLGVGICGMWWAGGWELWYVMMAPLVPSQSSNCVKWTELTDRL